MDREYIEKETPFKRPIAPALLTVSMADGLSILSGIIHRTGMALLGVKLDVKAPVFIGDTISVDREVLTKRETKKEDRGIITFLHRVMNQKDELVVEYQVTRMIKCHER
jgi:acyl dehydratase